MSDEKVIKTAKNLYRQQLRWGWGVENVPYLIFNIIKKWKNFPKGKAINRILIQIHGFHSWDTNALIIAVQPVHFVFCREQDGHGLYEFRLSQKKSVMGLSQIHAGCHSFFIFN